MTYPWMRLYTRDWLDSKELRRCSTLARAVLTDLMCLAAEGIPYGCLSDKVGPLTDKYMASRCVVPLGQFRAAVIELKNHERITEVGGVLFIQRMVDDESTRARRSDAGGKGGNPSLVNRDVNHEVKEISKPRGKPHSRARTRADSDSDSSLGLDSTTETKTITRETERWTEEQAADFLKKLKWKPSDVSQSQVDQILSIDPRDLLDLPEEPGTLAYIQQQLFQFEKFLWPRYWRKADKKTAREAWLKATGEDLGVMADALAGMEKQRPEMMAKEEKFRPHAATWFNNSRWGDESAGESHDAD